MTPDTISGHIKKQLDQIGREEQTALFMGFLEEHEAISRELVKYCASRAKENVSLHRGWVQLGETLEKILAEEREETVKEKRHIFLEEIEKFKKDCMEGKCVQSADFDDKRRAYADGDIYFEDYHYEFIDGHDDIQTYIGYARKADYYYKSGDYETASKAYRNLVDIYHHDTKVEHCFVEDDDFPDLDLSQIRKIDIDRIRKRHEECTASLKMQGNTSNKGGNELRMEE